VTFRLSRAAEEQIDVILLGSARRFGLAAADRYGSLIVAAMTALSEEPLVVGSADVPSLPGIRVYPIRLSRLRFSPPDRVRTPRHLIVYRVAPDGTVEILGLVHDRMVLSRAAARAARDAEGPQR